MMRLNYLRGSVTTVALGLSLAIGLNSDIYGQGKGHGGGNPHGGPPGQQRQQGGPPPDRGGGGGGRGQQRQQPQPQPQQVFRQQAPQQVFRQQAPQQVYRMPPGQARKQERVYQQPAPQQESLPFLDEHPLIRNLSEYGQIVETHDMEVGDE